MAQLTRSPSARGRRPRTRRSRPGRRQLRDCGSERCVEISGQWDVELPGEREFFYATAAEVKEALINYQGHLLDYADLAEAAEFRQSENERRRI